MERSTSDRNIAGLIPALLANVFLGKTLNPTFLVVIKWHQRSAAEFGISV